MLIVLTGSRIGGSFNPARKFGPHVLTDYHMLWAYTLAPLVGAVIADVLHRLVGAAPAWTCKLYCDPARYAVLHDTGAASVSGRPPPPTGTP